MTTDLPRPIVGAAVAPAGRDRFVDLLRAAALLVVVLGHWTMAVLSRENGSLRADSLLAAEPRSQYATWLLQVMPLFFVVGGYANAASLGRSHDPLAWVRRRAVRLLAPVVPLLAVWTLLGIALPAAGLDPALMRLAAGGGFAPLWFLAAYVAVILLAPALLSAHRRWGWMVPVALVTGAAAVDSAHRAGVAGVGWINFALVWGALHQLGLLWFDGWLPHTAAGRLALAAGGLTALGALVGLAGYAVSMVGVPGATHGNNAPPSVALVALGVTQIGLALAVRAPVDRWLRRPRVWRAVAVAGSQAMTLYLWHLTTLVVVTAALVLPGIWPDVAPLGGAWWALRPLWIAVNLAVLLPVVRVLAPVERNAARAAATLRGGGWRAVAGAVLAVGTVGLLVIQGVPAPGRAVPVRLELVAAFGVALAMLLRDAPTGATAAPGGASGRGARAPAR